MFCSISTEASIDRQSKSIMLNRVIIFIFFISIFFIKNMLIKNINTTTRFRMVDLLCQLNFPTFSNSLLRIFRHCSYTKKSGLYSSFLILGFWVLLFYVGSRVSGTGSRVSLILGFGLGSWFYLNPYIRKKLKNLL